MFRKIINFQLSFTVSMCLLTIFGSFQITFAHSNIAFIEEADEKSIKEVVLDKVEPMESDSTFIGTLHQVLKAAGDEWSIPKLTGTFGHAFSFSMKIGDSAVWQQANIDWWLLWEMITHIGYTFYEFQILHHDKDIKPNPTLILKTKEQTWNRVKESIDRGIPAIA